MTSTPDQPQVSVMIPGMPDALDKWLARYHELFIERTGAPANDSEAHARRLEEAGLMGQAFSIIFQVQNNLRRGRLGLGTEGFRAFDPAPAGAHPFDAPALPVRNTGHDK